MPASGSTDLSSCHPEGDRNTCTKSYVYYPAIMGNAQVALGFINKLGDIKGVQIPLSPSYPPSPSTNADFQQIVKAIGFAIGAVSAHETGHQLSLPFMECTGGCPEPYVYQIDGSGNNYEWFYRDIPTEHIHWSKEAECSINNFLLGLPKNTPCK